MSKEQTIFDMLSKSNFRPKLGAENISIPCPLAPYTPLHKNNYDTRPSMGIKVTDGSVLVHCFTCGFKSGQLSYLYSRLAHHDSRWQPALNAVRDMESKYLGDGLMSLRNSGYNQTKSSQKAQPLDESLFEPFSRKFAPYLHRRGITLETGERWGVGVDQDKHRAIIPVRDVKGNLWGAVGRSYNGAMPKYLNYWEMKKGTHLMGAQLIKEAKTTIIVEGTLDAMLADQAIRHNGLSQDYNVVSILGSQITESQAHKLVSCSNAIVVALDADQAGERGTKRVKELLSTRLMTKYTSFSLVGKKDFGDCSESEIIQVIQSAKLI
jgi:5S rRNA maturation endonuclease (ribonuclease M5)